MMKKKPTKTIKKIKAKPFVYLTPLEASHEMARDLYEAKLIDEKTMRKFDARCLPKIKDLSSTEIKRIRAKEKLSQAVFAHYLNTSVSTIKQWEIGAKHPRGTSLKLLNLVNDKGIGVLV
ncbi:MAG: DNA-binding transcriptional regulator [Gammaproteobacteria bacterium]|nr:DNA-binding transcriptional regulator [Gammaproteobacteria bacterium]